MLHQSSLNRALFARCRAGSIWIVSYGCGEFSLSTNIDNIKINYASKKPNASPAQPLKLWLLTYSSPKGQMLHQPSLSRALFARRKAEGDVGNRTGAERRRCSAGGDVGNRTGVILKV
jgi:hypothetical protein